MVRFVFHGRLPLGKAWIMYRKSVLKNGVRLITEQSDHLRSASLGIWVNAGSRDEVLSENGAAHFIEHMTFKGTRNRSTLQIAKELDAIGGLSNAFTGRENTCFLPAVLGHGRCITLATPELSCAEYGVWVIMLLGVEHFHLLVISWRLKVLLLKFFSTT